MIKKVVFILSLILCANLTIKAQDSYIVQQFGYNLSNWAANRNTFSALEAMERLCSKVPAFRIGDQIMHSLAKKNGLATTDTYDWDNYVACMQKEVDNGVTVQFSNIQSVSEEQVSKNYKGFQYASCNIKITGASNFDESALFIIKNGRIAKIQTYETIIDGKTGKRKIKVDWSGLDLDEDTEGWGISYNYGKSFPIGASIAYTKWKFMISADFGVNTDKDLYTTQKTDFTNIVDYKVTRGEYDLKYFVTATPAFYLKYFAVGWGFGFASFSGTEYTKENSLNIKSDGTIIQSSGSSTSMEGDKYKFMMRPTLKGYIPCNDNLFISISVNYDWILGHKEKSNISFGAGIHYLLD